MSDAAKQAARLLHSAEYGYDRKYGSVPIDTRIDLARAWTELARVEAQEADG